MYIYTKQNLIINADNVMCFEIKRTRTNSVVYEDEAYYEIIAHASTYFENETRALVGEYETIEEAREMLGKIYFHIETGSRGLDLRETEGDK